jgi:glycosyltransferase involved in cell wall biosynthesis
MRSQRQNLERRIRVCIAASTFYPYYSGAGERFRRYIPEFQKRGIDVCVFSGTPSPERALRTDAEAAWVSMRPGTPLPPQRAAGVPVHRVRLPDKGGRRRGAWFAEGLAEFCRRERDELHLVQVFDPSPYHAPGLWRVRAMGIPILAVSTMMAVVPPVGVYRAWRSWMSRLAYGPADLAVVQNEPKLEALRTLGVKKPIRLIPNGVDTTRFRPPTGAASAKEVRRGLGIPSDAPVLLFVGTISKRKGADLVLNAWAQVGSEIPDLHLILVGPGWDPRETTDPGFLDTLRRLAECSGAVDRIKIPGHVENVEDFMRAADLFLFPSRWEGSPNVVAEAMASGLPIIMCPFEGFSADFGTPGKEFILADFDAGKIASEARKLLANPRRRMELGLQARAWAEARLSWEGSLDAYVSLYRELALGKQTAKAHLPGN